ncbi:MAG: DEAD/DEAH box helicase, partial [Pseudomonadota bacterium]
MSDARAIRLPNPLAYAERAEVKDTKFDRFGQRIIARFVATKSRERAKKLRPILRYARRHDKRFAAMTDEALQLAAHHLRRDLKAGLRGYDLPPRQVGQAFSLIREASVRVLGMRHYDVQVLGAWAMLQGQVAEMRTGEGKTLCATLAAGTAAMAGMPVHLMTVNDYLASRDAEEMTPLYAFLGLKTSCVLEDQSDDERRALYQADIVYGTNKTFAFDYLRDRQVLRYRPGHMRRKLEYLTLDPTMDELRMRGLHFALVDEADSVLIDEARTPLIISGQVEETAGFDTTLFYQAMDVAKEMEEGCDFTIPKNQKKIELTDEGFDLLDDHSERIGGSFDVPVIRDFTITQALSALHLFHRDEAYIVRDDSVQIVDENTGRTMPDRTWSDGLHQMMEIKEGLEPSPPRETLARITYQRFFRRYGRLSGMTGTATDAAWELWSVYRLPVTIIPTNKKDIRKFASDRVYRTAAAKWDAVAKRTRALNKRGLPVLIGTRSVSASDEASKRLTDAGIAHQVLSAAQDADEAAIVAKAGQEGAVTIATNMAGRGTDIKLSDEIAARGGLHVLLTERHDSRRVDRQLEGRCGRQGQPGR